LRQACPLGVLVFDLDGTLIDSLDAHADAFVTALDFRFGVHTGDARTLYLETSGMPLRDQFRLAVDRLDGEPSPSSLDVLTEDFWASVQTHPSPVFPDVWPFLDSVEYAGYCLAVSSGAAPKDVNRKMAEAGLAPRFDIALGSSENGDDSKGPGHFAKIAEHVGLSPTAFSLSAIFIGDTPYDMQLGARSGLAAIGCARRFSVTDLAAAGARWTVGNFKDLGGLLRTSEGWRDLRSLAADELA
jgi:phosphoglycolate phosphatase-like HAD superfamily hydrolase